MKSSVTLCCCTFKHPIDRLRYFVADAGELQSGETAARGREEYLRAHYLTREADYVDFETVANESVTLYLLLNLLT